MQDINTELNTYYIGFRKKSEPTKVRIIKLDTELEFNYNQFSYLFKQVISDACPILVRVK